MRLQRYISLDTSFGRKHESFKKSYYNNNSCCIRRFFSAGGTVLLATNSRAALAESVAQNSRRKQMSCYALESKLLADRLNGRKTDKTELARYADKMVAYATGEEIEIIDSNGQVIFFKP